MSIHSATKQKKYNTAPPKNIIKKLVPGLDIRFDKGAGKRVWFYGNQVWLSLQEAVDALFPLFPAIKPWASDKAQLLAKAAAEKASEKEDKSTPNTHGFWNCECPEDYMHPADDEICGRCSTKHEDGEVSSIEELTAQGIELPEKVEVLQEA